MEGEGLHEQSRRSVPWSPGFVRDAPFFGNCVDLILIPLERDDRLAAVADYGTKCNVEFRRISEVRKGN